MEESGYPPEDFVMAAPQGGDRPPSPLNDSRGGGGSMRASSPPLGSQMFGPRDGVSIHSSRARGPDCSRSEDPPPYLRLAPLMCRVQDLKSRMGKLENLVPDSFTGVQDELDEVWKDLGDVRKIRASPPQDSSSTPSLFQG